MLVPRSMEALAMLDYDVLVAAAASPRTRASAPTSWPRRSALPGPCTFRRFSLCGDNAAMIGAQGYFENMAVVAGT
jgi:tRNA A37 threonylcarbamoyltransferase TsaD